MSDAAYDFIIVGAGATGCVLASRLSEDPQVRVLLLEAGPDFAPGAEPAAIRDVFPMSLHYPEFSWAGLQAEVGPDLGDGRARISRRFVQGFGVGGSSNIQGMVAFRGYPEDYDEWRDLGAVGWGWDDVLPAFKKLETDLDFENATHGRDGPIPIRRVHGADWAPFSAAFAAAMQARGLDTVEDFNADFRAGVGPLPMANQPEGRVSTAMGYLTRSVRARPNLRIIADAFVERVLFANRRATGIVSAERRARAIHDGREIVLAAGAIHSPAILMRSGLGPGAHLREYNVNVIQDLPGVGQHLMNHVAASFAVYLRAHAKQARTQRAFGQNVARLSSGVEDAANDIMIFNINKSAWHALGRRIGALGVEVHRTYSKGQVRLSSRDVKAPPSIQFNLLSDERDAARLAYGLRYALMLACDPALARLARTWFRPNAKLVQSIAQRTVWNACKAHIAALAINLAPVRNMVLGKQRFDPEALLSDEAAFRALMLERANPPHHVSSTCRMGRADDPGAVVDADCRVRNVGNLRVIDASVMPRLVRANTHIPSIMIGEKMAERLKRQQ